MRHFDVDGQLTTFNDISSDDITLPTSSSEVARILQVVGNTLFRQAAANIKNFFDNPDGQKTLMEFVRGKGPSFFTAGVTSRFAYSFGVLTPSLLVGDKMRESGYSKSTALVPSIIMETLGGNFLEVRATRQLRPEMKNFAAAFQGSLFPFLVRNSLAWLAIPTDKQENLFQSFAKGAFAGAVSAVPDTIGSKTMYKLATESQSTICSGPELMRAMKHSFRAALANPRNLLMASGVRTAAGGVSSVLLSEKFKEEIAQALNQVHSVLVGAVAAEPTKRVGDVAAEKLASPREDQKGK